MRDPLHHFARMHRLTTVKNMAQTSPQVQTDCLYDTYGKTDTNHKNMGGVGVDMHMCIIYMYM